MPTAHEILEIILEFEQAKQLISRKQTLQVLERVVSGEQLTLILFPCLTADKDQELSLDLFKTAFFHGGKKAMSKSVARAEDMANRISALGITVEIIACLADLEPLRVWGWQTDQEEMTVACQLMAEQGQDVLSPLWRFQLWSELEADYQGESDFQTILADLDKQGKHRLLIDAQEKHLLGTRHDYHQLPPREVAKRRVASYGFEGLILERVLPNAIFMQISNPYKIRDPLHQRLRDRDAPLPIIHPFRR